MSIEIEFFGDIASSDAGSLRSEFEDLQIIYSMGFGGERILKIICSLPAKNLSALRSAVLRVLGAGQISRMRISRNSVELHDVPSSNIDETKAFVLEILEHLE